MLRLRSVAGEQSHTGYLTMRVHLRYHSWSCRCRRFQRSDQVIGSGVTQDIWRCDFVRHFCVRRGGIGIRSVDSQAVLMLRPCHHQPQGKCHQRKSCLDSYTSSHFLPTVGVSSLADFLPQTSFVFDSTCLQLIDSIQSLDIQSFQ